MLNFNYYGHSCFQIDDGKYKLVFDPFLTGNPQASIKADDVKADYVLISHGHSDHICDAYSVAINNSATVITIPEVTDFVGEDIKSIAMNLGGSVQLPFGFVRMVPALHSSGIGGGIAHGFVVNIAGKNIYYAGDTALFSDMKLIGQRDSIDWAILPIGGHFTMDAVDAAKAVEFLNAKNVIPVHYNTWDVINQNPEDFKALLKGANVQIVQPGESLNLDA